MRSILIGFIVFMLSVADVSAQLLGIRLPQAPRSECDYCQCSQGLSPLEAGASGIRFEVRSLSLGNRYQGATKLPNPNGVNESYLTNQLLFFYHIEATPLTVVANMPYVIRRARTYPEDGSTSIITPIANGVGDVSLLVRAIDQSSWDDALVVLSISAGVKLPTGSTDRHFGDEFMDIDLQPGSGSVDLLLGGGAIWSMDRTTMGLNLLGGITGTGARGHRYGDYLNGELSARYRIVPDDVAMSALFATLGIGAETRATEVQDGAVLDDSGGSILYLAPGLQYHLNELLSIDAKIEIPLHQYLSGEQFGETYRFVGGLQWLL